MKKRLFLAITLPQKHIKILGEYKRDYSAVPQIRWTREENLHITVHFFGYEEEELISDISGKIKSQLKNYRQFNLKFENITFAPPDSTSRMIWAVFKENKQFGAVAGAMRELKTVSKRKSYKPLPHVTLARFKSFKEIRNIELKQPILADLQISNLSLYQSKLTPKGPIYTLIEDYKLLTHQRL